MVRTLERLNGFAANLSNIFHLAEKADAAIQASIAVLPKSAAAAVQKENRH